LVQLSNIDYDAVDDLQGDYSHLFEDEAAEVLENRWDEITQEVIEHENNKALDIRQHYSFLVFSF
jgi:hypothetical protein